MKDYFRIIAFLEGASYIILLFIAVPIKYLLYNESYVKLLGMPHGVLFILYIVMAFMIRNRMKWDGFTFIIVLLCSLIPFGTFYIDKKHFKKVL